MGKSSSNKSTPSTSRKDVRGPAPYRRARDTEVPAPAEPAAAERKEAAAADPPRRAAPLAKVKLVAAPAAVSPPAAPAAVSPTATAAAGPDPAPAPLASAPTLAPVADFLASLQTSLAFADAALAALPHPDELGPADPAAPEPPPGPAPAGDARSLRAGDQFALVYRHGAAVVSRRGILGQRGAWRVVDYPSAALAAHAYALECSRLVGQGFRDVA